MEAILKAELGTSMLKSFGSGGGGCISHGQGYNIDNGQIFVKMNSKPEARLMFDGEYASLDAVVSTGVIKAPKPIKVLDNPNGGAVLVMEYIDMKGLVRRAAQLGTNLARMHLANEELGKKFVKQEGFVGKGGDTAQNYITKFGFDVPTCCGIIPQDNAWCDDWVTFLCRQKLGRQLELVERDYGDRQARELWEKLLPKIPAMFEGITVKPALLHGDLWGGNVAETDKEPVIFDAASFYGHHEYELGIANMFGGFNSNFYEAYHSLIPKQPGFRKRNSLYQLFHYLNHWNHFGTGYRGQSIGIMKSLLEDL